jgi:hypothetical protein
MKVNDPLHRGLRTALQLTITLLSIGALVTVLEPACCLPREECSAFSAVLLPLVTIALNPGKEVVPGSTGSPQDAPTDGPLDPGSEG